MFGKKFTKIDFLIIFLQQPKTEVVQMRAVEEKEAMDAESLPSSSSENTSTIVSILFTLFEFNVSN